MEKLNYFEEAIVGHQINQINKAIQIQEWQSDIAEGYYAIKLSPKESVNNIKILSRLVEVFKSFGLDCKDLEHEGEIYFCVKRIIAPQN